MLPYGTFASESPTTDTNTKNPILIFKAIRLANLLDFNLDDYLRHSIKENKNELKKISTNKFYVEMELTKELDKKGLLKEFNLNGN